MTDLKTTFKSLIGVMLVEFNRPSTLNSLSPDLLHELIDLCNFIKNDDDIRVVVLEGSEENFSSGADLPSGGNDVGAPTDTIRFWTGHQKYQDQRSPDAGSRLFHIPLPIGVLCHLGDDMRSLGLAIG